MVLKQNNADNNPRNGIGDSINHNLLSTLLSLLQFTQVLLKLIIPMTNLIIIPTHFTSKFYIIQYKRQCTIVQM